VEEHGGTFQVRPHREFASDKGRDKMLSLAIFANAIDSSASIHTDSIAGNGSHSGNAYSFMQQRRRDIGDPSIHRHHSLIRMSNYSSSETPLCVCYY
jgi:DNA mismatch repair protein MSH5